MKWFLLVSCFAAITLCSAVEQSVHDEADKITKELNKAIKHDNVNEVRSLLDRFNQLKQNSRENVKLSNEPLVNSIPRRGGKFNEEIFKLLVKNGDNFENDYEFGRTPMCLAIIVDNVKAVKILLENGSNPNEYFRGDHKTALQKAIYALDRNPDNEEIINLLIEHGADINITNYLGYTPLLKAIIRGLKKTTELLIEKGANVNAVEKIYKMTPLHYIAKMNSGFFGHRDWTEEDSLKFAQLLKDRGANLNAKNSDNDTPYDVAYSDKLKELLRQ